MSWRDSHWIFLLKKAGPKLFTAQSYTLDPFLPGTSMRSTRLLEKVTTTSTLQ